MAMKFSEETNAGCYTKDNIYTHYTIISYNTRTMVHV
jgi:hypothetical protein